MGVKDYTEKEMRRILLRRAISDKEKHRIRKYFQRRSVPEDYLELLSPLEREWFKTRKFKITKRDKTHPIEDILENGADLNKFLKTNDIKRIKRAWIKYEEIFSIKDKLYLPVLFLYAYHPWIFHPATETVPGKMFNRLIVPYAGFHSERGDFVIIKYFPVFMEKFVNPIYRCEERFNTLVDKSKEFLLSLNEPFIDSLVSIAEKQLPKFKAIIPFKEENCKCIYDAEISKDFQKWIRENRKRKRQAQNK